MTSKRKNRPSIIVPVRFSAEEVERLDGVAERTVIRPTRAAVVREAVRLGLTILEAKQKEK